MLERLRKSRTEQKRRTVRAAILLGLDAGLSDQAIARAQGVNRNTVMSLHPEMSSLWLPAALGELPAFGQTASGFGCGDGWVQNCACQKPKELGYAQELWTYGLLIAHLRQQARAARVPGTQRVSRSKLHKILRQGELRPHKVRYYVERRNPEFESKMAAVLHVYKEVEILNQGLLRGEIREPGAARCSTTRNPAFRRWLRNARPASHTRTACQPDPGLRIPTAGNVSLPAGLDLHRGACTADRQRDA